MNKLNKYWYTSAQGVVILFMLIIICILSPIVFPLFIIGKLGQNILPRNTSEGESFQLLATDVHRELCMSVEDLLIDNHGSHRIVAEDLLNRIHNRRTAIETKG